MTFNRKREKTNDTTDRKIIVELRGGTGNQLFQLAACKSLAEVSNRTPCYSSKKIGNDLYKRKLETAFAAEQLGIEPYQESESSSPTLITETEISDPINFTSLTPLSDIQSDVFLSGYFANYRLHSESIKATLSTASRSSFISKKLPFNNYIALHTRELHGTGGSQAVKKIDNLPADFYKNCLSQMNDALKDDMPSKALIFMDLWKNPSDSKLLAPLLEILKAMEIEPIMGDKLITNPWEVVSIISQAKATIVSNSTLSWWGAYLSESVIYSPIFSTWEPLVKVPDHWNQVPTANYNPNTHHKIRPFDKPPNPDKINRFNFISKHLSTSNKMKLKTAKSKLKAFFQILSLTPQSNQDIHSTFS